ncbi:MAG: RNA polymerase factor sigma-54 [Proteobacteria bacterium]|nr:RNA polymerase factor sigma-54 [Pseudomonadota bacterium]
MSLSPKLDLRQSQSLVMTPQLQQAIKLLQLSNIEVGAFVEEELERNPLLERASGETADRAESTDAPVDHGQDDGTTSAAGEAVAAVPPDDPMGATFWRTGDGRGGGSGGSDDLSSLEQTVAGRISLYEHLAQQIQVEVDDPRERLVATHLLAGIDEAGYLTTDLDEAAATLGCPVALVEAALERLQTLDPPGVFARDLRECLALQLAERNRLDPVIAILLTNLEQVARRDFARLCKLCDCSEQDLADMLADLRMLDPKPGLRFDTTHTQVMIPDVVVRAAQAGGWHVELNSDTLPRVLANERYYAEVQSGTRSESERSFVSEHWNNANWLVKALDQRARTILRVAREIVRQQDLFLVKGVAYMKPLILRDIADALELHESTVSRVTSNKFMATPRGIFELKYFFTASIGSTGDGPAHSAEAVRHRIKTLIEGEAPNGVLSDDDIVEALAQGGVAVARRTVAKYRKAMRIPSSVQRRRERRLAGEQRG